MFFKIGVLRNFPIFTGKHLCWGSLFNKGLKDTSTQVFFCDYCEIFTKIFFDRKPPVASVDLLLLNKSNVGWFLLKRVELFYSVFYTLLVETILTHFY